MPTLISQPHIFAAPAFGLVGAALSVAGVYLLALRWRKRRPLPYCLSAFVLFGFVYIATFQHGVLNSELGPGATADWLLTTLIAGQAAVTSVGVAAFTLLTFGAYLFVMGELDYPVSRIKSYAGCAVFCFFFSMFFNPIGAARDDGSRASASLYQTALTSGSPEIRESARREAERTLSALREIGALAGVDATDAAVIHHVKGQFIDLPNAIVEEYMRAALVHHVLVEGGVPKRVILREAGSDRQIALREPNGTFRRNGAPPPAVQDRPPDG